MMFRRSIILITANQLNNTTTAVLVRNDASVDSGSTDERISAVHRLSRPIGTRPSYDHGCIDKLLVPNSSGVQNMVAFAIGPAPEWKTTAIERATVASIQTTR